MQVTYDTRDGNHSFDTVKAVKDLGEAQRFIAALDGQRHTLLIFDRGDGNQLMIGGGASHFVVTRSSDVESLTLGNERSIDLDVEIEVCAGGQYGYYSSFIVHDCQAAVSALGAFFSQTESSLFWI